MHLHMESQQEEPKCHANSKKLISRRTMEKEEGTKWALQCSIFGFELHSTHNG